MGCGSSNEKTTTSSNGEDKPLDLKIVVLGIGGVGKSALTFRFIQNKFMESYNPTIEDSYRKAFKLDSRNVVLDILDTAGQEEYMELREVYMRGGEGFIIVYSIIDQKSFKEVNEFRTRTLRVKDTGSVPMVLVGNKCDLNEKRQVTKEQGEQLAKQLGVPFFETSAALGTNCEEIFQAIAREVKKAKEEATNK